MSATIQAEIESKLAEREPEVEVLLAELKGDAVELYIDHPEGVTLELCERVTHALPELLEEYGLTVSSPGPERPLSKPEHFRRFIGRRARVRTRDEHDGRRSFTGELRGSFRDGGDGGRRYRHRRHPVRRHLPIQPRRVLGAGASCPATSWKP